MLHLQSSIVLLSSTLMQSQLDAEREKSDGKVIGTFQRWLLSFEFEAHDDKVETNKSR